MGRHFITPNITEKKATRGDIGTARRKIRAEFRHRSIELNSAVLMHIFRRGARGDRGGIVRFESIWYVRI